MDNEDKSQIDYILLKSVLAKDNLADQLPEDSHHQQKQFMFSL